MRNSNHGVNESRPDDSKNGNECLLPILKTLPSRSDPASPTNEWSLTSELPGKPFRSRNSILEKAIRHFLNCPHADWEAGDHLTIPEIQVP